MATEALTKVNLQPLGDRVLLKPIENKENRRGGLIIPETAKEKPQEGEIVAIGFYGSALKIGYGSLGGWDTFGPERLITKSSNNVLYELDHKPALMLYKEYLGEKAKDLPGSGLLFPST